MLVSLVGVESRYLVRCPVLDILQMTCRLIAWLPRDTHCFYTTIPHRRVYVAAFTSIFHETERFPTPISGLKCFSPFFDSTIQSLTSALILSSFNTSLSVPFSQSKIPFLVSFWLSSGPESLPRPPLPLSQSLSPALRYPPRTDLWGGTQFDSAAWVPKPVMSRAFCVAGQLPNVPE